MKFIVDECVGPVVARWLRSKGHDAISVFDDCRGANDDEVIEKALAQELILVTSDKDFGEKVFSKDIVLRAFSEGHIPSLITYVLVDMKVE